MTLSLTAGRDDRRRSLARRDRREPLHRINPREVSGQSVASDPAREFLSGALGERVAVDADAADVAYDRHRGGYTGCGPAVYVGWVEEVHDWGIVCGGWTFRWATRWDLINWAAADRQRVALPVGADSEHTPRGRA